MCLCGPDCCCSERGDTDSPNTRHLIGCHILISDQCVVVHHRPSLAPPLVISRMGVSPGKRFPRHQKQCKFLRLVFIPCRCFSKHPAAIAQRLAFASRAVLVLPYEAEKRTAVLRRNIPSFQIFRKTCKKTLFSQCGTQCRTC